VPAGLKSRDYLRTVVRTLAAGAILLFTTASDIQAAAHGLPESAVEIARPLGFPITNSMVVTWIVALALIGFAQLATRKMTAVPGGAQNLLEWLVQSLYEFLESIIGAHLVKRTFWFFATIFIFILAANWLSLLPGVGTIGWGHQTDHGFAIEQPLFRGAIAMSLVFVALWIYWALREVGVSGIVHELFAPKGETAGALKVLMIFVFLAAGLLEIVSILFRPVSLSFRLYGNIFAGENMLDARGDGDDGAGVGVAAADPVLFHGTAGGPGAGDGLHAADGGVHAPHLPAPRRHRYRRGCAWMMLGPGVRGPGSRWSGIRHSGSRTPDPKFVGQGL
jgi:F-type H+-transporting ATPase subunit a